MCALISARPLRTLDTTQKDRQAGRMRGVIRAATFAQLSRFALWQSNHVFG